MQRSAEHIESAEFAALDVACEGPCGPVERSSSNTRSRVSEKASTAKRSTLGRAMKGGPWFEMPDISFTKIAEKIKKCNYQKTI
jgi:hypothetical protein